MNWLAHLHLASLGKVDLAASLLPDIINTRHLTHFTLEQQRAIRLHQAIDRFTDSHSLVLASKRLLAPTYTRFAGVLVDIFYDYCLSIMWEKHNQLPLEIFINKAHMALQQQLPNLPMHSQVVLQHLIEQNWLSSYQTHTGIEQTLKRMSARLNSRSNLAPAVALLQQYETCFKQNFAEFYPQLKQFVGFTNQAT